MSDGERIPMTTRWAGDQFDAGMITPTTENEPGGENDNVVQINE